MNNTPWLYNEFTQVGKDYADPVEVEMYDARHGDFRDIEAESNKILDTLGAGGEDILIDFGCGTGTFAIEAAKHCKTVYGVDVSRAMLDYARTKAAKAGAANIEFVHGGFLTFDYDAPGADFLVTTFAFHHLPDYWKGIALKRLAKMLKPGGRLYMHDVIIEERQSLANIAALIDKLAAAGGEFLREDAEAHFREEFSTYDWVMDGLLGRAGFTIKSKDIQDGVIATYTCVADGTE